MIGAKGGATADVTGFLEEAGVDFDVLGTRTERAADEAAALGIGAEEVAKTLVLVALERQRARRARGLGAVDLHKVAAVLGVGGKKVHLASEDDLERDYPDFELGRAAVRRPRGSGDRGRAARAGATRSWSRRLAQGRCG